MEPVAELFDVVVLQFVVVVRIFVAVVVVELFAAGVSIALAAVGPTVAEVQVAVAANVAAAGSFVVVIKLDVGSIVSVVVLITVATMAFDVEVFVY